MSKVALNESRYKKYPEYKDSGGEWLGKVPEHWSVIKLKYVVKLAGEKVLESNTKYVGMENVISGNGKYLPKEDVKPEGITTSFIKGDVLFGKLRPYLAKSWLANFSGICSSEFLVLRSKLVHPKFLNYFTLTDEFIEQVNSSTYGSKMPRASWDFISLLEVPVSSFSHSKQIANFLDHETAKIDALIDKQQQLISLLKEKRQAVISHAVTRGLNPDAPMKDSGVEWLGEVPEHWDVCLFKHKCNEITDGAHISPDTKGGEHYFVSITDIKEGVINFNDALLTSSQSYEYLIKTGCMPFDGDVLFSKDGTIGQTAITPSKPEFVVASSLIIIRPDKTKVTSLFLDFMLQSSLVKEQVESFVKGAALRRLSIQNLLKVFGVFPPLEEQQKIANYVQKQLLKYKVLEGRAYAQVNLLRERRTALISAAVTGKIDVRHFTLENGQTPISNKEAAMEASA